MVQQLFLLGIACRSAGDRRSRQCANLCVNVLGAAVGVEEIAGNIDNLDAVPGHAQAVLVGNGCDNNSLDILLGSCGNKGVYVLCTDNDSHALLRLGDSQLGAVQTVVLLRYGVQVDVQTVSQLADGNGYTARTEVVAAANHAGDIAVAEEPVAPPQPSRPVLPPSRMTMSPGSGTSRMTFSSGAAPTTAPISMRLAT